MCGRYRLTHVERLAEKFEAIYRGGNEELAPRYNIAPTQPVPVVRPTESRREITSMRWGLISSRTTGDWSKLIGHYLPRVEGTAAIAVNTKKDPEGHVDGTMPRVRIPGKDNP